MFYFYNKYFLLSFLKGIGMQKSIEFFHPIMGLKKLVLS